MITELSYGDLEWKSIGCFVCDPEGIVKVEFTIAL